MEENILESEIYNLREIPGSESWIRLAEITEGDSTDRKFYVKNNAKQRFFLRIADPTLYDRKKNEYEYLQAAHAFGAAVPDPVGFGLCNNGKSLYLLTRWIYGNPGAKELLELDRYQQYSLGVDAGLFLKMVHHCRIPPRQSSWESRQQLRYKQIMAGYRRCGRKIGHEQKLFNMIQGSLPLLADRPQTLLHGGFHTGNIILSFENSLSLIDFDNWQYGDPLADLANVLTRIRHVSLPYAIGILDCYFAFRVNDEELRLMALYGALDLIGQLAEGRDDPEMPLPELLERIQVFIRDFQGCKNICPSWYKRMRISDKV